MQKSQKACVFPEIMTQFVERIQRPSSKQFHEASILCLLKRQFVIKWQDTQNYSKYCGEHLV